MQQHGCVHAYEIAVTTPVSCIISNVATVLHTGGFSFKFATSPRDSLLAPEDILPLQLLEVVNCGWQCNNGQVYQRKAAHCNQTVQEFMDNWMRFALPNLTIQRDMFVIYMSKFSLTFCFDSFVNDVVQPADATHSYTWPQSPLIVPLINTLVYPGIFITSLLKQNKVRSIPTWKRTFWLGIVSDHCTVRTCANDIILTVDW